jgi:hypothetical protein
MARSTGFASFARRVAVGAAFIVAAGTPAKSAWAGAGSLTGTYEGKASCSGLENGVPAKQKIEFAAKTSVLVSDFGSTAVLGVPAVGSFFVFIEDNSQKQGQSLVNGLTCTLDLNFAGATIFLNAKVKGDKATLKGTLVILDDAENQSAICKISLKRVDAADPNVVCDV